MKALRYLAVGLFAALISTPLAYAAGLFPGLPLVAQAAYCGGYAVYSAVVTNPGTLGTPNACVTTVPIGPLAVTGQEYAPFDTGLTNQAPSTVSIAEPLVASGAFLYDLLASTAPVPTQQIPNFITNLELDATTTISAVTLTMPTSPLNGQILRISSAKTITTLLLLAPNQTLVTPPVSLATLSGTGSFGYSFLFVNQPAATGGPINTWFRLQ